MGLFRALKDVVLTPPELRVMAEIYSDERVWNLLVKLHNMRIAQLGEEIMGTNTMTPEGQIKEHGLKERVIENEHFLQLFQRERERQEKVLKTAQRKDLRQKRFKPINRLQDL